MERRKKNSKNLKQNKERNTKKNSDASLILLV